MFEHTNHIIDVLLHSDCWAGWFFLAVWVFVPLLGLFIVIKDRITGDRPFEVVDMVGITYGPMLLIPIIGYIFNLISN